MVFFIILFILVLPIEAFAGRDLFSDTPDVELTPEKIKTDDTIYYCHATLSTGFHYSKSLKKYEIQSFNTEKFIIKLDADFKFMKKKFTPAFTRVFHWPCKSFGKDRANHRILCTSGTSSFHINVVTGKYLMVNAFGYISEPQWEIMEERTDDPALVLNDSVVMQIGFCDTFN